MILYLNKLIYIYDIIYLYDIIYIIILYYIYRFIILYIYIISYILGRSTPIIWTNTATHQPENFSTVEIITPVLTIPIKSQASVLLKSK